MDGIKSVLTRLQVLCSVMWWVDFVKAFIAFRMSCGVMVHV